MSSTEEKKFIALDVSGEHVNTCYHEAGTENKESVIFAQTGGAGASAYMCWYRFISNATRSPYRTNPLDSLPGR